MKKAIKKLKSLFFVVVTFTLILQNISCEKEEFIEQTEEASGEASGIVSAKHYKGEEALNFVNEKKLIEIISNSDQYRNEFAYTIDYSEIIQVIEENEGENITIRVNHPNQKPFMFYNLVISTSLNGTTARLLEYTMTPRFFNSYSSGITSITEFEGIVLSQLIYSTYPCDKKDEMLVIAPYDDFNLIDNTTGTIGGVNLINSGFFNGRYRGTTFTGVASIGDVNPGGSGSSGGSGSLPHFTDGLNDFLNSIGSALSSAYEWTTDTIRVVFRWIRNLFCGSCSHRASAARGPSNELIIIDDNNPPTNTPEQLQPCDWFYTNFALFQINTIIGYNPNRNLTPVFLTWWDTIATDPVKVSLLNYLNRNPTIDENTWEVFFQITNYLMNGGNKNLVQQFLQSANHSNLNLDFEKSLNSPANIDFSGIDKNTPEGQKFDCIYKKLMESSSFKNLFVDTFGGEQTKLNVKFEIVESLTHPNASGTCQLIATTTNNVTRYTNLIKIKKSILEETNGLGANSNISIANTIIHELIHAYLNIKKINCNSGATLPYINNLELGELIQSFYQNFDCQIDVDGSPQSQHDFMFNFLIPTFQNIHLETKNLLISAAHINHAEGITFTNENLGITEPWNWNNFFKYISLGGLHQCESFGHAISDDPVENFLYNVYYSHENSFTKNCN